jgi:hypothetical protein
MGLYDRVSIPGGGSNGIFSLHHRIQTVPEAHPASYPSGTEALTPGVKGPYCEADHSPPFSADVKNA